MPPQTTERPVALRSKPAGNDLAPPKQKSLPTLPQGSLSAASATGRLSPAYAAQGAAERQQLEAAHRELLQRGPPGTAWQVANAIFGEGVGLGLIAAVGFNGANALAQLYVAAAMGARLPENLSPAAKAAASYTAAFLVASFAAGLAALVAQVLWAPLGVGMAQQTFGAHEIQKQDPSVLFPPPDPYANAAAGLPKLQSQYIAEWCTTMTKRAQCIAEQGGFALDGKKAFVLITLGFWIAHDVRIALAPLDQNLWAEGLQTAVASLFGAGLPMAFLAYLKWRSTVTVDDAAGTGAVGAEVLQRKMKVHFIATIAPKNANTSAVVSKLGRNWDAFAHGREGEELAAFTAVQWLKLSGGVHLATFAAPLIQAAAAAASDGASDRTRMYIKMGATDISYTVALYVLLNVFPAIAAARGNGRVAPGTGALLAEQDAEARAAEAHPLLLPDIPVGSDLMAEMYQMLEQLTMGDHPPDASAARTPRP